MSFDTNYYTRNNDELYTQIFPTYTGRHQADYDYNGALDKDDDPADYYHTVKAVRLA